MSEHEQLQALYRQAKAEGGEVTVYMGGDAPDMWDALADAFSQQFPDVRLHLVTDLSKYHDARIDNQLATDNLVADVAVLQTTQDFDRWKRQGEPQFKDKLILTYPNDDDAVLFGYKQIVDQYGWEYLGRLMAQNPTFVRGVPGSSSKIASGEYLASIAVGGDARPNGTQVFSSSERFTSWAQRGAVFKQATWTWSVLKDVAPPAGLQPLASYRNTDPDAFARFTSDRGAVERFRSQVELYVGKVNGANPADPQGTLGLTPGAI